MMKITELIAEGNLKISEQAPNNLPSIESIKELGGFTAAVVAKEYPGLTTWLWNETYKKLGLPDRNVFLIGSADEIQATLNAFRDDPNCIGGSVGVGIKDVAWRYMDELDPLAKAMESINVIAKDNDGRLTGYNTDGMGYVEGLEELTEVRGKTALILGGGGTASAIAFALANHGATPVVLNRTVAKAQDLAGRVNTFVGHDVARAGGRDLIAQEAPNADIIISVIDDPYSPLDQYSALGEITMPPSPESLTHNQQTAREILGTLKPGTIVSDVMIRNTQTATLRLAAEAGFTVQDGRPMVLNQGIEAFWLVNHSSLEKQGITRANVAENMRAVAASK